MSHLTKQQIELFNTNGYIIINGFCSTEETNKLLCAAKNGRTVSENDLGDQSLSVEKVEKSWWAAGYDGLLTNLTHREKTVTVISQLLQCNSPVCHIDAKFIEKEPKAGASSAWHQDYACWYANQLLFPDQVTSMAVALTATSRASGCSQLIKGSHKMGRLDHGFGEGNKAVGADINMVNNALNSMELIHLEMQPGDAVFFHSNLLHRCKKNLAQESAWFIVSTYASEQNLATNNTLAAWHQPIEVISNEAVLERNAACFWQDELVSESTIENAR